MTRVSMSQAPRVSELLARPAEIVLRSGAVSNQASLPITDLPAGYRSFRLEYDGLLIAAASASLFVRVSTDNGVSYDAGASDYRSAAPGGSSGSTAFGIGRVHPGTHILCNTVFTFTNGANDHGAGEIVVRNPRNSGAYTMVDGRTTYTRPTELHYCTFGGVRLAAQDDDAFQVIPSTGNIAAMNWTLIGVRAS